LRSVLAALCFAASFAISCAHGKERAPAAQDRLSIRVTEGGWGNARPADIEAVLNSAARELFAHFPGRSLAPIVVSHSEGNPRVLYQRGPNGEYLMQLSAGNRRWSQYAYQFAHEFCHVLSNYDNKQFAGDTPIAPNQWLEESLCEAASLFTLRSMANSWEAAPPYPQWRDYAPLLRDYAGQLAGEAHRHLAEGTDLSQWYRQHRDNLRGSAYLREYNEVLANVLASDLAAEPRHWTALAFLNADKSATIGDLGDYIESWSSATPEPQRAFVQKLAQLLGVADEAAPLKLASASLILQQP
jgi:hypothetical protein